MCHCTVNISSVQQQRPEQPSAVENFPRVRAALLLFSNQDIQNSAIPVRNYKHLILDIKAFQCVTHLRPLERKKIQQRPLEGRQCNILQHTISTSYHDNYRYHVSFRYQELG